MGLISDESRQIVALARLFLTRLGPNATYGALYREFGRQGLPVDYKQLNRLVRKFNLLPARPIRRMKS